MTQKALALKSPPLSPITQCGCERSLPEMLVADSTCVESQFYNSTPLYSAAQRTAPCSLLPLALCRGLARLGKETYDFLWGVQSQGKKSKGKGRRGQGSYESGSRDAWLRAASSQPELPAGGSVFMATDTQAFFRERVTKTCAWEQRREDRRERRSPTCSFPPLAPWRCKASSVALGLAAAL